MSQFMNCFFYNSIIKYYSSDLRHRNLNLVRYIATPFPFLYASPNTKFKSLRYIILLIMNFIYSEIGNVNLNIDP